MKLKTKIASLLTLASMAFMPGCIFKTIPFESVPIAKPMRYVDSKQPVYGIHNILSCDETIEMIQTPAEVLKYFSRNLKYEVTPGSPSFCEFNRHRSGDCFEYSISAAALLSDNGYPATLLFIDGKDGSHALYLYQTEKGYGALSTMSFEPQYKSIEEIVEHFADKYDLIFDEYSVIDLDKTFPNKEWIYGDLQIGSYLIDNSTKINR
jgi:hypothetical protein